ncbi:MAG: PKD domain-containing protein [Crocinitomicaceae bacterium]
MKTMKLFLTFALVGIFQMASAQMNVIATGQLTNTNAAAINVTLVLFEANNTTAVTVLTNPNGVYTHTFVANTDSGSVYMQVEDCNFDSIFEYQPYDLITGDTIAQFTTFDYCPTITTSCQAFFYVNQSLDTSGTAIASQVSIIDSSSTTGTGNLTYTWDFGDGSTGTGSALSHTYSGNGPYLLCLTIADGFGCTDTYCDTISVDSLGMLESEGFTLNIGVEPTLSVETIDFSSAVNIFPNPAVNFINIKYNTGNKELNRVTMVDLSGKIVFDESNTNSSNNITTINTENIAPGTYLIQMLFDNEIHNEKVIIK